MQSSNPWEPRGGTFRPEAPEEALYLEETHMCVIAVLPPGVELTSDEIEGMYDTNPDGFGYMYARHGTLRVGKTTRWKDVIPMYRKARRKAKGNLVLHFRWGTHGAVNEAMCHPFMVSNKLAVVHNGVIPMKEDHKTMSDTALFVERVLKRMSGEWWKNSAALEMLENCVGVSNKLVLLDVDDNLIYINRTGFSTVGKVIVSNTYWMANTSDWGIPNYRKYRRYYTPSKNIHTASARGYWKDGKWIDELDEPIPLEAGREEAGDLYCAHCKNTWTAADVVRYPEGDLCPLCYDDLLPIEMGADGVETVVGDIELSDQIVEELTHAR